MNSSTSLPVKENCIFAVETFLEMMLVERGISDNTLTSYERDLVQFQAYLRETNILDATTDDILSFLEHLASKQMSAQTRARKLSALRQFYGFHFQDGSLKQNPCLTIESPKVGKTLPKYISEDQVEDLFRTAYTIQGPEGVRLQTLLEILYATGLRVTELLSLPYASIESAFETETLVVMGKGMKERIVPLSPQALKSIKKYLSVRDSFGKGSTWLFPSRSRQGHLTRQRFDQLLKSLAVTVGLDRTFLSAHLLRHAFATHMLQHGADLASLQKLLGHSDIATTEIYTHVLPDRLREAVTNHHPLSKLKK